MNKTYAELEMENKQLKELIKEGKQHFSFINEVLGIEKAVSTNMLMLKIPSIIRKVQNDTDLFSNIGKYLEKLKNINLD